MDARPGTPVPTAASVGTKAEIPGSGRLLIALNIAALSVLRASLDMETDSFWTAREGLDFLGGQPLLHLDHWGWGGTPQAFVPNSPAWQVLVGLAWKFGGSVGLMCFSAFAIAVCLLALTWIARQFGASDLTIIPVLAALTFVGNGLFVNRAALPALVLLLVELVAVWRWRSRLEPAFRARVYVQLAASTWACSFVGIWLHNSWSAWGPAAALGTAMLLFGSRRFDLGRRMGLAVSAAAGALLGVVCGPLGTGVWTQAARVAEICRGLILEWSPPLSIGVGWLLVWVLVALTCVWMLGSVLMHARADRQGDVKLLFALGALGAVLAGAFATRLMLDAMVVIMPLFAAELTRLLRSPRAIRVRTRWGERGRARYWRIVLGGLIVPLLPIAALSPANAYRDLHDPAVAALPPGCRLFSSSDDAGAVILLRPDVRVWIDGRQDLWGRKRIEQGIAFLNGSAADSIVPAGTSCVLLLRNRNVVVDPGLSRRLESSAAWQRLAVAGSASAVWVPTMP